MKQKIVDPWLFLRIGIFFFGVWLMGGVSAHAEPQSGYSEDLDTSAGTTNEARMSLEDQAAAEMADMLQMMELLEKMEFVADLDVLDEETADENQH
jgi:hypothetical protein